MGRTAHADYIKAALEVLQELGGGPISTKVLVAATQERGLIGDGKWVYHNFSRKVRESSLFDTSIRGKVSLAQDPPAEALASEVEVAEPVAASAQQETFPGPTLGSEN